MNNFESLKALLNRIGRMLPPSAIYNLNASVNYLAVGQWMQAHGYQIGRRAKHREELFDRVGSCVADRTVLYMEFGVYQGAATRYWSRLLRNPKSQLHGFDSFEGLPEEWLPHRPKSLFTIS